MHGGRQALTHFSGAGAVDSIRNHVSVEVNDCRESRRWACRGLNRAVEEYSDNMPDQLSRGTNSGYKRSGLAFRGRANEDRNSGASLCVELLACC
jgi:hypothetical protein